MSILEARDLMLSKECVHVLEPERRSFCLNLMTDRMCLARKKHSMNLIQLAKVPERY